MVRRLIASRGLCVPRIFSPNGRSLGTVLLRSSLWTWFELRTVLSAEMPILRRPEPNKRVLPRSKPGVTLQRSVSRHNPLYRLRKKFLFRDVANQAMARRQVLEGIQQSAVIMQRNSAHFEESIVRSIPAKCKPLDTSGIFLSLAYPTFLQGST